MRRKLLGCVLERTTRPSADRGEAEFLQQPSDMAVGLGISANDDAEIAPKPLSDPGGGAASQPVQKDVV